MRRAMYPSSAPMSSRAGRDGSIRSWNTAGTRRCARLGSFYAVR